MKRIKVNEFHKIIIDEEIPTNLEVLKQAKIHGKANRIGKHDCGLNKSQDDICKCCNRLIVFQNLGFVFIFKRKQN